MIINSQQALGYFPLTQINLRATLKDKARKIRDIMFKVNSGNTIPENFMNESESFTISQMLSKITSTTKSQIKQTRKKENKKEIINEEEKSLGQFVLINKLYFDQSKKNNFGKRKKKFQRSYSERGEGKSHSLENSFLQKERIYKGSTFSRPNKFISQRKTIESLKTENSHRKQFHSEEFKPIGKIYTQPTHKNNYQQKVKHGFQAQQQTKMNYLSYGKDFSHSFQEQRNTHLKNRSIKTMRNTHAIFKLKYHEKIGKAHTSSEKKLKSMSLNVILVPLSSPVKDYKLSPWNQEER